MSGDTLGRGVYMNKGEAEDIAVVIVAFLEPSLYICDLWLGNNVPKGALM